MALLNENSSSKTISTTASAIGLGGSPSYRPKDLWPKATSTTSGSISASVPRTRHGRLPGLPADRG
ncbi:hypothetical protein AB0M05_37675 [Streptomyces violaceusniger]|uniref:hypothetical protein n=1 Tax=Streptomyces violaceusniger TaxID=68280 RepID=UPI00342F0036